MDDTDDVVVIGGDDDGPRSYRTAAAVGREVASLVRAGRISGTVRAFALDACRRAAVAPYGDPCRVAGAILAHAAGSVQYAPDPVRAELVQGAPETIRSGAGDCEDFTALVGAACESLGLPARVVLIRYAGTSGSADAYDHVFPDIDVSRADESPCWLPADATLWGASGIVPALGFDPSTLATVAKTLVIAPHASTDSMTRSLGFPISLGGIFGGAPGGSNQFNPFGSGGGFQSNPFGSGGFQSNPFGSGGGPLYSGGGADGTPSKAGGGGGSISLDDVLRVITTISPIIAAIFGKERQYAASRGAIYNPTTAGAPPGYTRMTDPQTGQTVDVPNDLRDQYAQRYADQYNAQNGGFDSSTLLLLGGVGLAAYFLTRKKGR